MNDFAFMADWKLKNSLDKIQKLFDPNQLWACAAVGLSFEKIRYFIVQKQVMAEWLRLSPVKQEVEGSNPSGVYFLQKNTTRALMGVKKGNEESRLQYSTIGQLRGDIW